MLKEIAILTLVITLVQAQVDDCIGGSKTFFPPSRINTDKEDQEAVLKSKMKNEMKL